MKQFELNQTYCKVLYTISKLNEQSYYPLNEGVYKILVGIVDDEVLPFANIASFGTLTSYTSKKICHLTLMLFRKGFIGKVFDPESKKLYLRTTEKGELALKNYFVKHKKGFAKRKQKNVPTIGKIAG